MMLRQEPKKTFSSHTMQPPGQTQNFAYSTLPPRLLSRIGQKPPPRILNFKKPSPAARSTAQGAEERARGVREGDGADCGRGAAEEELDRAAVAGGRGRSGGGAGEAAASGSQQGPKGGHYTDHDLMFLFPSLLLRFSLSSFLTMREIAACDKVF